MADHPSPDFATISAGFTLPELRTSTGPVQMFHFSAASWMGHRIHYDQRYAIEVEGFPDLVVSTAWIEATFHRLLSEWAGPGGWVLALSLQNRGSAWPEDELVFSATVMGKRDAGGERIVELACLCAKADGTVVTPGTAQVRLANSAPR